MGMGVGGGWVHAPHRPPAAASTGQPGGAQRGALRMRAVQGGIRAGCTGGNLADGASLPALAAAIALCSGPHRGSPCCQPRVGSSSGPERRRGALPGSSGAQCCPGTVTTRPGAAAPPDPAAPCPKTAALLHACRPALNDCSLCPKSEAHCLKFATLYPMSASRALCLRPRAPGLQPLLVVFCTHLPPARPVGCAPYPQRGCPSLAAAHSTPGCGCRWRECPVRWGNPSPPHKWRSLSKPGSHLRA